MTPEAHVDERVARRGSPAVSSAQEENDALARTLWETTALVSEFKTAGNITKDMLGAKATITNPGLADTLLAEVTRLGHRDFFPRPYDWENLIPQLEPGEELLWMVEKSGGRYSIHLGVKFGTGAADRKMTVDEPGLRHKRLEVLCDSLARRSFPESELTLLKPETVVTKLENASRRWGRQVTCVAGVPSPKELEGDRLIAERDEEKRPFASLNDAMEALIEEDDFAVVFSVAKASPADLLAQFRAKALLRDRVRPFVREEIGDNWSDAVAASEQKSEAATVGKSLAEKRNILFNLLQSLLGASIDGGWWRGAAAAYTANRTYSTARTVTMTEQRGGSVSRTHVNTLLEFLDNSLGESMKHLQMAIGTGGYYGCGMVYAADRDASRRIGKTLAAVLSGSQSHLRPMQILPFEGEGCMFQLNRNVATHALLARGGVFLEILDCEQAGRLLLLPDAELPGLKMRRSVFYGRPDMKGHDVGGAAVEIGTLAFARKTIVNELDATSAGSVKAGTRGRFAIAPKDLCSHLLLVGTTGSGKTMRAASILNGIPPDAFRILVLETAKKTYRDLLRRDGEAPCVYTLGDAQHNPFRLNPFCFDPETGLKQHISVLADAMGELLPVEALIAPKLREAAERCYRECGWDIESGRFLGSDKPNYPDMICFNLAVHDICKTFEDYGPEVRANYKGALLNRARIFIDDLYQDIFALGGNRTFSEVLARDTIIEMEEMPPSEINMPAFIISMALQRLRAHRFRVQTKAARLEREGKTADAERLRRENPPVLLVIEEAHNVLHRKYEQERSEREAGKGKRLVEQVSRLMMEGRQLGIGVMVVDQSPKNLADAVIANANTKLVFRQEDGDEVRAIGTALGIPEKDWPDLQRLADGECVVKSKVWSSPVKLAGLRECPPETAHATAYTAREPPRYGEALRELKDKGGGWAPTPSEARPLAKKLLRVCEDRMDLVRFILGKHWIEAGDHCRAKATVAIADYGALVKHLETCAKPSADMAVFLNLLGAVFLGMDAATIQELARATCQGRGPGWLPHMGEVFLRELQGLVQADLSVRMAPEHSYYGFRDALRAWVAMVGGHVPVQADSTPVDEAAIAAVRSAATSLDAEIKTLLVTAVQGA